MHTPASFAAYVFPLLCISYSDVLQLTQASLGDTLELTIYSGIHFIDNCMSISVMYHIVNLFTCVQLNLKGLTHAHACAQYIFCSNFPICNYTT